MADRHPVKIMHIGSILISGPNALDITVTARIDLDFEALQRKFIKEDLDPLEMDNIQLLVPLLREKLDITPFVVKEMKAVSVSKTDIVVVIDSYLEAKNDLGDRQAVLDEYERLLRNKLTGLID